MDYHINFGIWGSIFAVPTKLVDRHLKMCSEWQLKVLLMALRYAEDTVDTEKIAKALPPLTVEDVEDCLSYWQTTGIFSSENKSVSHEKTETKVLREDDESVTTTETYIKESKPKAKKVKESTQNENIPLTTTVKNSSDENQKIVVHNGRTKLTPSQIHEMSIKDPNIPMLLQELQQQLARPISSTESEEFIYYYSYMNLDPGYMLMVVAYCIKNDKKSMHAIVNELKSWVENGVNTLELAENYIIKLDKRAENEDTIKTIFNIKDRALTKAEREFTKAWYEDLNLDSALIELAYERTFDSTGKASLAYANKILLNWVESGIRTAPQAIEEIKRYEAEKNGGNVKKNVTPKLDKKSGMSSFDLDDIEKVLKKNMEF